GEVGTDLALRTAVNIDDHGALACIFCGRPVEERRDGTVIPCLPVDQLGLGESGGVEPSGLAEGPALDLAGGHVERIDIVRLACGAQAECQLAAVVAPLDS